jgi:hypothetical protein
MPVLRLNADPQHAYGGRVLTVAVQVVLVAAPPDVTQGIAVSRIPNYLVFQVPRAASYAVQYALGSGSARLEVLSADVTMESEQVWGRGMFTVDLDPGLVVIKLMQEPVDGPLLWRIVLSAEVSLGKP